MPGKHAQHHITGGTDVIPNTSDTSSGLLSPENKQNYDDAYEKSHEHENKSIIDTITQALLNAWNSAYTHISDAIRHITSDERTEWNAKETTTGAQSKANAAEAKAKAYTDIHDADTTKHITSEERTDWDDTSSKKHEHSNKTVLDTITELIINGWDSAVEHISDLVKHITSDERTKWNAVTNKADKTYVDEELNNKAASVHGHVKADITDFPNLSNVATSGSYNDLSNKPTIPTDTNQLAKTDVYTKTEVDNKLGSAGYGDMMKAVYDTDEDGVVDEADIANTLKVSETKKITITGGIGTMPDDAAYSPVSLVVKGNTWTNRAGTGDTSPQTVENLDNTKTYLLIKTDGGTVNVDGDDINVPAKLTGATSYEFEWTEGKIALYELSATEAALTEAELGARYHYVDSTKSTLSGRIQVKDVEENVLGESYYDGILRSLPNGTNDEVSSSGVWTQETGDLLINGSEAWTNRGLLSNGLRRFSWYSNIVYVARIGFVNAICDKMPVYPSSGGYNVPTDIGFMLYGSSVAMQTTNNVIYLTLQDGQTPQSVLSSNPVTLIYQLASPIITKIEPQVLTAKAGDTIMWIPDGNPEDSTTPELEVEYVVDMGGTVNKLVDTAQLLNERAGMHSDNISELQIKADTHETKSASMTQKGHVQLSTSTTSTSTTMAATPSAVKVAMDKANEAFQSASEQIKIKPNITILATGWVDDSVTSGYWLYNIADADITADTVVDVNIHLAYLEKAESIKSANLSSTGKATIYADEKPVENIVADLKLIRQVNV